MNIIIHADRALNADALSEETPLSIPSPISNLKKQMNTMQITFISYNKSFTIYKYDHHVNGTYSSNAHSDILVGGVSF